MKALVLVFVLATLLHGLVQQYKLDQICQYFQIYLLFVGVLEVDWQNDECSATEDSECSDAGKNKINSKTETQPSLKPLHCHLSKRKKLVLHWGIIHFNGPLVAMRNKNTPKQLHLRHFEHISALRETKTNKIKPSMIVSISICCPSVSIMDNHW